MLMVTPPTFDDLFGLFTEPPAVKAILGDEMPEPYLTLLVHANHMTVTVEGFYDQPVNVKVLESRILGEVYSRQILLSLSRDGRVVQFGVVRINLAVLPEIVRREILAGGTPLGRVLIQNQVLTRVQPAGYLTLAANADFAEWFAIPAGTSLYGRLGVIYAGERPAIEVLEVLAPIER